MAIAKFAVGFPKKKGWGSNMGRVLYVLSVAVCVLGFPAKGAVYEYHPSSPLHIAGGFDPLNPFELTLPCVEYDSIQNVDTEGAVKTRFTLSLVKSREELYKHLQVSASLSANYYFYSGGGGFEMDDESSFHADSLTWIVKAGSDYGRYLLKNPRLSTLAQGFIDRGEHDEFARRCGTEAVLEQRKGAMIASIFTLENLSSENKHRLQASFKGGADLGFFDISMTTEYKDFYRFATTMGKMKLDVFAIGGNGVTALKDLVQAKPYDLQKVGSILGDYTGSLTPEKAVPREYITASMQKFGWKGNSLGAIHRNTILSILYTQYKDNESVAKRIDRLLRDQSASLTEPVIKKYREQYDEYMSSLVTLRNAAIVCEKDLEQCKAPNLTMSAVFWPKGVSDWDLCESERNWALTAGLIDASQHRLYRARNYAPLYVVAGVRSSGIDGWFSCEQAAQELQSKNDRKGVRK